MKPFILMVVALLTLGAAKPHDWSHTVTRMPDGAYVLGNPAAKLRLTEFLSYSCPHCAHFNDEASGPLRSKYIMGGRVALELRNAIRDRYDFAAAMLARCGGARMVFANSDALFAAQKPLMDGAIAFEAKNSIAEGTAFDEALKLTAAGNGLSAFMIKRGFSVAQLNACLVDKVSQKAVIGMTHDAWEMRKIPGTPAFFINGVVTTSDNRWATIETQIRAALTAH